MLVLAAKTVGVIGSGLEEHDDLAVEVGQLIAELGANLLTGAGGGVMTSVSAAYVRARNGAGVSIGIIPCESDWDRATPRPGYPNVFVELPIYTHLPYSGDLGRHDLSRNHIIVLSCAALVALPGGAGTASEVDLALRYCKPIVVYAGDADSVTNFSPAAPHVTRISDVRDFLQHHLLLGSELSL